MSEAKPTLMNTLIAEFGPFDCTVCNGTGRWPRSPVIKCWACNEGTVEYKPVGRIVWPIERGKARFEFRLTVEETGEDDPWLQFSGSIWRVKKHSKRQIRKSTVKANGLGEVLLKIDARMEKLFPIRG
jgi:hypothetical protein